MTDDALTHRLLDCTLAAMSERAGYSRTLTDAMHIVSAIASSDLVILPAEPTPAMVAAGADAGGVDADTVRRILAAVYAAAE